MAKNKKDVQITISADNDTREIRVRMEQDEIIVERISMETLCKQDDNSRGK